MWRLTCLVFCICNRICWATIRYALYFTNSSCFDVDEFVCDGPVHDKVDQWEWRRCFVENIPRIVFINSESASKPCDVSPFLCNHMLWFCSGYMKNFLTLSILWCNIGYQVVSFLPLLGPKMFTLSEIPGVITYWKQGSTRWMTIRKTVVWEDSFRECKKRKHVPLVTRRWTRRVVCNGWSWMAKIPPKCTTDLKPYLHGTEIIVNTLLLSLCLT